MDNQSLINEIKNIGIGLYQLKYATNIKRLVGLIQETKLFESDEYSDLLFLVNKFLENKDYILLADLLTYELIPNISNDDLT